jgi:hypothetical protein
MLSTVRVSTCKSTVGRFCSNKVRTTTMVNALCSSSRDTTDLELPLLVESVSKSTTAASAMYFRVESGLSLSS